MSKKSRSGAGGGGTAKMSITDRMTIASIQRTIDDERRSIPSFVKEDMTKEQIQEAVIRELQKKEYEIKNNTSHFSRDGIKELHIASTSISQLDLDGRFVAPQDKKFAPLIRVLNRDIKLQELLNARPDLGHGAIDYGLHRMVEQACARYTTRELTQFLNQELHTQSLYANRASKISAIALAIQTRHAPATVQNGWKTSLSERTRRFDDVVSDVKRTIDNMHYRERQIQTIRDKYKTSEPSRARGQSRQSRQTREAQRRAEMARQARREQIAAANRAYEANRDKGVN